MTAGGLGSAVLPNQATSWDPFQATNGPDPLERWLDLIEAPIGVDRKPAPAPSPKGTPPTPVSSSWASRLGRLVVGEESAERLELLVKGLEVRAHPDPFGLSPEMIRQIFPWAWALHRLYFRVFSSGHHHIPATGPVILAANHAGLLPFDGVVTITDVLLRRDPPRLVRAILDRWVADLPIVRGFMAGAGQVIGTHEGFDTLLAREEAVLVFPEGMDAIRKTVNHRYRLLRFRHGFVAKAIRARAPIVPVAILGSEDQAPILFDVKPLARLLGLPMFPITPTFPWLGPLGLLPYPVSYRIIYGEPLRLHEEFGPAVAEDPLQCKSLAVRVRGTIQELIDGSR